MIQSTSRSKSSCAHTRSVIKELHPQQTPYKNWLALRPSTLSLPRLFLGESCLEVCLEVGPTWTLDSPHQQHSLPSFSFSLCLSFSLGFGLGLCLLHDFFHHRLRLGFALGLGFGLGLGFSLCLCLCFGGSRLLLSFCSWSST